LSSKFRIGTLNVNNFFDRTLDFFNLPTEVQNVLSGRRRPKNSKDIYSLASRILKDRPHIMAFQEVEDKKTLDEFNSRNLGGRFKSTVLIESIDPRGIDVAVGSQKPIGYVKTHQFFVKDKKRVFSRDLLEVEVLNDDRTDSLFTLFVTHLKSHYGDDEDKAGNDERRRIQAETAVEIIKESNSENNQDRYMLCGDLNDLPGAPPINSLVGADNELEFYNITEEISDPDKRWTHFYKKENFKGQYDYILLSPELKNKIVTDSVKVVHSLSQSASDHRPLYVTLDFS
jgi:endonuclease/exonuclease/phosphatase family metal-dependent hydrolase